MNHHCGSFLPETAAVAKFVFVEVGGDDHLLYTIVKSARTGQNNGSTHTSGIPSLWVLVTSLRH